MRTILKLAASFMPSAVTPEKLSRELCCVRCGTPSLVAQANRLQCRSCDMQYPIAHGVPILFPDVVIEATTPPNLADIVAAVFAYQGLQPNQVNSNTLTAIFSQKYRFSDFLLDVESQQYLDRIHSTQVQAQPETAIAPGGHRANAVSPFIALKAALKTTLKTTLKPLVPESLRQNIRQLRTKIRRQRWQTTHRPPAPTTPPAPLPLHYEWVRDYLPRTMLAQQCFTGNVRLHNCGDIDISSQGPTPVMMSYHWQTAEGQHLPVLEHRTPFPIDLQPGQQITVPMLLETPAQAGHYQLQLCLVQEHVCWHEADAIALPITITTQTPIDPTATWQKQALNYSYYDDHQQGIAQLKAQLQSLKNPHPKILEIGGNACPMLSYDFGGHLYNLDIDVHGLQIGHLTNQQQATPITFLCADAHAIPFPDGYFDCITMFASLHHFPDLPATLRSLAQKIQPQGFLAMLCEPVGHYYGAEIDPLFRAELLKGVNEQSFSLDEYAAMFADADLVVDRVIVDGGSLKAFLKKPSLSNDSPS